ncbi:MAG TPA: ABC transporter ATP-binding protein [Candidatus Thermoplasmatota archaeon]
MPELAITTHGLTKRFKETIAVDGIDLEVAAGTVYGLLGPNGAGKTTTIHLLLGLIEPTSGVAQVLGLDPQRQGARVRAQVGALLEHHGLYERVSAERNLEYFGRINGVPLMERHARAREALEHIGLWDRRRELVGKWSKGMKQKLAIARALLHRPPLVFLDEPTAGHDPASAKELRDQLREIVRAQGGTVFLSTHNLTEAEALCARVGIIQRGRLLIQGTPHELRSRGTLPRIVIHANGVTDKIVAQIRKEKPVADVQRQNGRVEIQLHHATPAAPIVSLLVKGGAEVEEVHKETVSLEEAYIQLTTEAGP